MFDAAALIYDNLRGSLLASDAGTQLSRGRITVHTDAL
jgi:hypothetical protein